MTQWLLEEAVREADELRDGHARELAERQRAAVAGSEAALDDLIARGLA